MGNRFVMSLPSGDRGIGPSQRREATETRHQIMHFDNNASSCNRLRAVPEISMSSSPRASDHPERVQAAARTCVGKDAKIGLTDTF
jgi:hypothetical protein